MHKNYLWKLKNADSQGSTPQISTSLFRGSWDLHNRDMLQSYMCTLWERQLPQEQQGLPILLKCAHELSLLLLRSDWSLDRQLEAWLTHDSSFCRFASVYPELLGSSDSPILACWIVRAPDEAPWTWLSTVDFKRSLKSHDLFYKENGKVFVWFKLAFIILFWKWLHKNETCFSAQWMMTPLTR